MRIILVCVSLVSCIVRPGCLAAGTEYAPAVRGAFLNQGMGARAAGMGEAFTAVANDATAVFWNPGGLGQLSSFHASVMYDRVGEGDFGDDMSLSRAAVAFPIGPGVAGMSAIVLMFGPYSMTDSSGMWAGEQTDLDYAGALGYAIPSPSFLGGKGRIGVALEYVQETEQSAMFGVSIGTVLPLTAALNVGLAARHLGPSSDGFSLPGAVAFGVSYWVFRPLRLSVDAEHGIFEETIDVDSGVELWLGSVVALRAGYRWHAQESGTDGVTLGVGLGVGKIGVDLSRQPYGAGFMANRAAVTFGSRGRGSP